MTKKTDIPSLMKALRARAHLTQEKLAAKLGVSFPTVNRWEKGKNQPEGLALQALATFVKGLGPGFDDLYQAHFPNHEAEARQTAPAKKGGRGRPRKNAHAADVDNGATGHLAVKAMEELLWKAACSIRGEQDAPKFKDYILPLIFIKRLSDVFDDELRQLTDTYGDHATALEVLEADHSLVRFYIPPQARWNVVNRREPFKWPKDKEPKTLGEQLTSTIRAIARANTTLQGVIDIVDYNETRNGEREISDDALNKIIELLSNPKYRLGLNDVEPDFLGRAYEYLLRKFAEGQGQSAGEFFTPKEVGILMARLMQPQPGEEVYDPCCGSAGLLVKCQLDLKARKPDATKPLHLYGQEMTGSSFAIARMNMIIHDMEGDIVRGNTMLNPKFLEASKLKQFDVVVTNPMWNQDNFTTTTYESDPYERFATRGGYAPQSSADWAWIQHIHASLKPDGRAAVVVDTGAASRGSGGQGENKEKAIRKWFVDMDLIEAVIQLPENLFYNTTSASVIIVLSRKKSPNRKGKITLINAEREVAKGRPKNFVPEQSITRIAEAFHTARAEDLFVKVVESDSIVGSDYNLSPSFFVASAGLSTRQDIPSLLKRLSELNGKALDVDSKLASAFSTLGYKYRGRE